MIVSPSFGDPSRIAGQLFSLLDKNNLKIFIVECSTGGFISSLIVKNKGASRVFEGGIIPYSYEMKKYFGGDLSDGAVSESFLKSIMLKWVNNSNIVIGESSILGPAGGTTSKPVGLSFVGVASKIGVYTFVNLFTGMREEILRKVASSALFFAINHLKGMNLKRKRVSSVFVQKRDGKVLVLRRSMKVGSYRGRWGVVSGHIEQGLDPYSTAYKELGEEVGISKGDIKNLISASPFEVSDENLGVVWEIYPFRAEVEDVEVKIDWEHTDFRWINPEDITKLRTAPFLYEGYLKTVFAPIR